MTVKTRAKRKVKVSSGDRSFLPNLMFWTMKEYGTSLEC